MPSMKALYILDDVLSILDDGDIRRLSILDDIDY